MIYDKLTNIERYESINPNFKKAVDYIKKVGLENIPEGKTLVDGDNVFVLNMQVDSYDEKTSMFEYHNTYADLHIVVDSKEKFYFEHKEFLVNVIKEFSSEEDVALYKKDSDRNLLKPHVGEFLLFFPHEAHLPKYTNTLEKIRKVIFKIKI